MLSLIYLLLIGLTAGWIASRLTKTGKPGVVGLLTVGVAGSLLGSAAYWLLDKLATSVAGDLVFATAGAVLCIRALRKWG
ncbi:hypothetical protein Mal64_26070 [Pseudobythopirellula maris]|uniref:Transglycosylase associated protein n=1 Tax=Pseudobythopirellula maris TaxID=2527991 RepID=A0A5C5ZPQ5_9BACT|nr:GlsB/YeaQ/YmgE family stress response membrane protein [Pseudobythopirellula maris]TWT89115.1 hypothetical protein Mal64_26070 [Pseudobythopirellula maris]